MKYYKGLYYNDKSKAPSFEHGAHFKYLDLVTALQKLQNELSSKNDIQNLETNYSPVKNDILVVDKRIKKRKKYRLSSKILNTEKKDNQRYNEIDTQNNNIETEKNDKISSKKNSYKDSIKANKSKHHIHKDISKSIDRNFKKLPIINNHNSISLKNKSFNPKKYMEKIIHEYENDENNDNNENFENNRYKNDEDNNNIEKFDIRSKILGKSKKHHKKDRNKVANSMDVLPKINSFYYQQKIKYEHEREKENEDNDNDVSEYIEKEKQNELKNTIDANSNNIQIYQPRKKISHKIFNSNLFMKDNLNKNDIFSDMKKSRKELDNYRLKSIFETEKQIKDNKNYIETINNEMARQIHHLKINLLNERTKKTKDLLYN